MKKLFLTGFIVLGLLAANPMAADACPKYQQGGEQQKCKISKLKEKVKMLWSHKDYLKLSDKQLDQLKDIKHQAMKDLIRQEADVKVVMVDYKSAMWEDVIDTKKVNALIDQKYDAKKKIAKTFTKALAGIQSVLNDDQRAKVKEMHISAMQGKGCPVKGCQSCAASKGKFCPLTGKPIGSKGSGYEAKGSRK